MNYIKIQVEVIILILNLSNGEYEILIEFWCYKLQFNEAFGVTSFNGSSSLTRKKNNKF